MFCPVNKGCIPENVKISCAPASGRKKRDIEEYSRVSIRNIRQIPNQVLTITFNIEMIPPATDQTSSTTPSSVSIILFLV